MILKRLHWLIPIIVLAFFATSCASTSKAPESKSNEAKTFEAPADKGTVFLYRIGPGTFFRWDFKPGTYTFSSSTGESSAVIQLDVKAGQVYFVRQDARMGINSGRVTMKEVDAKKGESEVKSCKLLVSAYVPD